MLWLEGIKLTGLRTQGNHEFKWHGKGLELNCNQQDKIFQTSAITEQNMRKCLNTVVPYSLVTQITDTFNINSKEKCAGERSLRTILISDSQRHTA
jgi:hypothetical protein